MPRYATLAVLVSFSAITTAPASSQSAPPTNVASAVPIRELGPIEAKTKESVGLILGNVRHLPSGSLLVNDAGRRRVLLFDQQLATYTVVIDSTEGSSSYGPRASPMIAYLGDSSLFVDAASQALLVIDQNGKVARVMSAPNPRDLPMLSTTNSGVDDRGRLVYRGRPALSAPPGGRGAPVDGARGGAAAADRRVVVAGAGAPGSPMAPPDSSPIVRADFDTRKVDTIALLKTSMGGGARITEANGRMTVTQRINPLSTIDEWAVLSDGSVAMVRGHDYHIDWYLSDGTKSSSGKLPFDWRRLTDDDKQKLIDSAQATAEAQRAAMEALGRTGIAPGRAVDGGRGAVAVPPPPMAIEMRAAAAAGIPGVPTQMTMETEYVPLNEIPDYYPPIRPGAAKPDADGNLWILPTTTAQSAKGELVYDVVNRASGLVFRARIPAGRSIVGFGRGGIVYMMTGSRAEGFFIERARLGAPTRVSSQ